MLETHNIEVTGEIRIPFSNSKILLLLFAALIFVALGIWLVSVAESERSNSQQLYDYLLFYGAGIASLVVFGACAVVAVRKFFDDSPALVLNPAGLTDNSSAVSAGFVPWKVIQYIDIDHIQGQKFIAIVVENPEAYLARGNVLQRLLHRGNMRMTGTPINISSQALKIKHQNLLALISAYFAEYGRE